MLSVKDLIQEIKEKSRDKGNWDEKHIRQLSVDGIKLDENKKTIFQKMFIDNEIQFEKICNKEEIEMHFNDFKLRLNQNLVYTDDYKKKISWNEIYEMIIEAFYNLPKLKLHDAMSTNAIFNISDEYNLPKEYMFYDAIKIMTNIAETYTNEIIKKMRVTISTKINVANDIYTKIIYLDVPLENYEEIIFAKYIDENVKDDSNDNNLEFKKYYKKIYEEYIKQKNIINYFSEADILKDDMERYRDNNGLIKNKIIKHQKQDGYRLIMTTKYDGIKVIVDFQKRIYQIVFEDEIIFTSENIEDEVKMYSEYLIENKLITKDEIMDIIINRRIQSVENDENKINQIISTINMNPISKDLLMKLSDIELTTIIEIYLFTKDVHLLVNDRKINENKTKHEVLDLVKKYVEKGMDELVARKFIDVKLENQSEAYERYLSMLRYQKTKEKDLNYRVMKARTKMKREEN